MIDPATHPAPGKVVYGDIVTLADSGHFDVIIHGCNCFHTMGAGLALQIKNKWPRVYAVDKETKYGDITKLGKFSSTPVLNRAGSAVYVVNAYTQHSYGMGGPHVSYAAISEVFVSIAKTFSGKRIAYPLIGCGLAGGNWDIINPIIQSKLRNQNHTLVIYRP